MWGAMTVSCIRRRSPVSRCLQVPGEPHHSARRLFIAAGGIDFGVRLAATQHLHSMCSACRGSRADLSSGHGAIRSCESVPETADRAARLEVAMPSQIGPSAPIYIDYLSRAVRPLVRAHSRWRPGRSKAGTLTPFSSTAHRLH